MVQRKKPLDFGGNPDHVTLKSWLWLGRVKSYPGSLGMCYSAFLLCQTKSFESVDLLEVTQTYYSHCAKLGVVYAQAHVSRQVDAQTDAHKTAYTRQNRLAICIARLMYSSTSC